MTSLSNCISNGGGGGGGREVYFCFNILWLTQTSDCLTSDLTAACGGSVCELQLVPK